MLRVCVARAIRERLIARAGRQTESDALQRMAAQMPAEEKATRSDFVIRTDGTIEETEAQVEQVVRSLNGGRAAEPQQRSGSDRTREPDGL